MLRIRSLTVPMLLLAMTSGSCSVAAPPSENDGQPNVPMSLPGAAVYACDNGEEIEVAFSYDPSSATLRRSNGQVLELPLQFRGQYETYGDDHVQFESGVIDAKFTVNGAVATCEGVSRSIAPPAIDAAKRDLRKSDDGATIEVATGETFSVSLVGVPTAGYQWAAASIPTQLEDAGDTGGPTSTSQNLPGFAGGNHWEVLGFKAVSAGRADLVLEQRRPFEDESEPAADTFRVTVVVR